LFEDFFERWLFSFSTSEAWPALQVPEFQTGAGFLASDFCVFAISRVNERAVVFVLKCNHFVVQVN
jgi:hypothetical protein